MSVTGYKKYREPDGKMIIKASINDTILYGIDDVFCLPLILDGHFIWSENACEIDRLEYEGEVVWERE